MKILAYNILFASILVFCGVTFAYAQTIPSSRNILPPSSLRNQLVPPFAIIATPSSPSPGQQVTITTQTTSFDPQRTHYTWTVDGEPRPDLSGLGKNSFVFTAARVGSSKHISVQAEPLNDPVVTAALTVYITDVAMTWTANTYIPKWYKGKALPIPNAMVRVAAIPTFIIEGVTIPADKLIYTWENNGERVLKGVGKQILEFKEPEQSWDAPTIVLTIEDIERRVQKEARTMIVGRSVQAVIYQSFPLGGVEFRRGTSAFLPVSPGIIDVQIEPFFFDTRSRHDLSYEWSVQGNMVPGSPKNPFLLTLDAQQQSLSNIPIYATIQHKGKERDLYLPLANGFVNIPINK